MTAASFNGTEVVSDRVDVETYAAFNRAVSIAVGRISADKKSYMRYFIEYYRDRDPEIGRVLTVDDLRPSRLIVQRPGPIPEQELQRSYNWIRSWGMLGGTLTANDLVDLDAQSEAHSAAG